MGQQEKMNSPIEIGTDMRANGIDITESLTTILAINLARSSIKFRLFAMPTEQTLVGGQLEQIGSANAKLLYTIHGAPLVEQESVSRLSLSDVVGHCVVHGGNKFLASVLIDAEVITRLEKVSKKLWLADVADLFCMQSAGEHSHGLPDSDFDSLFIIGKPITFNFHGYPWLSHCFAYRRTHYSNLSVRGYKGTGNINTSLELAMGNEIDRFSLVIDAINRVPRLQVPSAHVKEKLPDLQIDCHQCAHANGIDKPEIREWCWPN